MSTSNIEHSFLRRDNLYRRASLELGAASYVEKPFDPDLLMRRMVHYIEKERAG